MLVGTIICKQKNELRSSPLTLCIYFICTDNLLCRNESTVETAPSSTTLYLLSMTSSITIVDGDTAQSGHSDEITSSAKKEGEAQAAFEKCYGPDHRDTVSGEDPCPEQHHALSCGDWDNVPAEPMAWNKGWTGNPDDCQSAWGKEWSDDQRPTGELIQFSEPPK